MGRHNSYSSYDVWRNTVGFQRALLSSRGCQGIFLQAESTTWAFHVWKKCLPEELRVVIMIIN